MRLITGGVVQTQTKALLHDIILPLLCLLVLALFTGLFFSAATRAGDLYSLTDTSVYPQSPSSNAAFACSPNGDVIFPWQSTADTIWDPSLFLSITLGFGKLSFTAAKAIDIAWDLVVGRGGQLLLAWMAYPIVRKSLLSKMEKDSVRLPVAVRLAFGHGTLLTLWTVAKDVYRRWTWRLIAIFWIFVYLLAFGVVASAMTGYQANSQPYYQQENSSNLISLHDIRSVAATMLAGGSKVGLPDPALIIDNGSDTSNALYAYWGVTFLYCDGNSPSFETNGSSQGIITSLILADHDSGVIPQGHTAFNASWFNLTWTVDETASAYWHSSIENQSYDIIRCNTTEMSLNGQTYTFGAPGLTFATLPNDISLDPYRVYLDANGQRLNQTWLAQPGISQCNPESTYQWGFSSLLLFVFCISTTCYTAVILVLRIDVWYSSRANRIEQDFSLYRDILDFADVIREHLGKEADEMPAKKLEKSVKADTDGIFMSLDGCPPARSQKVTQRLKRVGTNIKAGHAYSWGETKRTFGLSYGPVWKHPDVQDRFVNDG